MSYCRFGEADAYIIATTHEGQRGFDCCGCSLRHAGAWDWRLYPTVAEMLDHIAEHRAAGHDIPESVDEEIRGDECWITEGRFAWEAAR